MEFAQDGISGGLNLLLFLAVGILLANAALMEVLTALGVMLIVAKILTELTLLRNYY